MSAEESHPYLELRPVTEGDGWDPAALAAAIGPATLPSGLDEDVEKAHLRAKRGWRDPRGLFGYSKDSPYKDLFVYFDAADRSSPVNVAASKAFYCYGLDGRQGAPDWSVIRGPCVIMRLPLPTMRNTLWVMCIYACVAPGSVSGIGACSQVAVPNDGQMAACTGEVEHFDFEYKPLIGRGELVDTLLFFRERDAQKVALKRDATQTAVIRAKVRPYVPYVP
ncbi:hypothetical protein GPECTOR_16g586 [Gonium pectorale]|uniref:Uncharacterized protein n=1 Tax=Gonium pectorale TaxID=33097 RepID=A0A150GKS5_GONPE|nr:hypothetical protein GPECTOR_16g586 [Gonium pectorale]|eukprot:KXZ50412.1 hypothetical protein GPECTOR_16g586 [Gonium pectorale]